MQHKTINIKLLVTVVLIGIILFIYFNFSSSKPDLNPYKDKLMTFEGCVEEYEFKHIPSKTLQSCDTSNDFIIIVDTYTSYDQTCLTAYLESYLYNDGNLEYTPYIIESYNNFRLINYGAEGDIHGFVEQYVACGSDKYIAIKSNSLSYLKQFIQVI